MSNIFSKIFGSTKQTASTSSQSVKPESKKMIVTDKDGNEYKTVKIGSHEWTTENLTVERYRNGDLIPHVRDKEEWSDLKTGAWCYYNNNPKNGNKYGKLYNWYAVNDSRRLAPEGWHVPSDSEWTKLTDNLGGITKERKLENGSKYWYIKSIGGKLKARTLWNNPNTGATNESGFSAFPGGFRYSNGNFTSIGKYGNFWSASEYSIGTAWNRVLYYDDSGVASYYSSMLHGLSVRCVKD